MEISLARGALSHPASPAGREASELKELLVHRVNRVPGAAMLILTQHGVQRG